MTIAGGTGFGTGRPSPEQPRPEPDGGPPPVETRPSAPSGPPPVEAYPAAKVALADLEKYVLDHMKKRNIRAGSLAVARGKELVYAGAFTWAEPDYPTTQPHHKFRCWSVAKPFTSIGIFRLIDNPSLILESSVASLQYTDKLRDLVEIDGPWKNAHWDSVRLVDLMAMKVKWRNNDPDAKRECDVFEESMPVPDDGLPRLKRDIMTALADVEDVIDEQLYHRYWYTNYSYTALGYVIQELTRRNYAQWMKDNVWAAAGISGQDLDDKRVDISLLDPLGALLPYEVRPEEGVPVVGTPAWQFNRLEPGPYGWNPYRYDAHGGWSAAPYDVVRLLAALGDDAYCSANLMSVANRDTMWKPITRLEASSLGIPTGSALGGWGGMTPRFNGQAGGGSAKAWHRRSDKLTFAYAFNIDPRETKWQGKKMTAWLSDTELVDKIEAVIATGGFAGADLWPLAGYAQPL